MNPDSYITLDKACDLIGNSKTDNYAQYFRRSFLNSSTIQKNSNDSAKEYINLINEHKDLWFQGLPKQLVSQKSFQRVRTAVNRLLENEEFLQEFGAENAKKVKSSLKGYWLCNKNNYLDNSRTQNNQEQPQEIFINEQTNNDKKPVSNNIKDDQDTTPQENQDSSQKKVLLRILQNFIKEQQPKNESHQDIFKELYNLTSYLHACFNSNTNDSETHSFLLCRMKKCLNDLKDDSLENKIMYLISDLENKM